MTFDETYKRLLATGELGLLGKREKVMREVWNSCIAACAQTCESVAYSNKNTSMLGPELNSLKCAQEIEKLKA